MCACACVFVSAYNCRAAVQHKRVRRKQRQREADSTHAIYSYHHTHAARGMSALNHNTSKTIKQEKKPKRGTTSAHTLIAPVKQNTHTHRERERVRGRPLNAMEKKTKTVTVLRPCSQAGRQRCVWCKREHQRACMGVHAYIQWAHYVCASWDEVRARVHARGHTQRERRTSVCAGGARLSLPHSHAATTAAAAAHATTRRSKRGKVVWETAVLLSLSPVVVVVVFITVDSTGVSFGLASLFSFCFSSCVLAPSAAGSFSPVVRVLWGFVLFDASSTREDKIGSS
ncbi:nucleolar RNA helicase II [Trypanosoma cruzi]|uniref:Nucleolar RNA helicase II n=1 Tax=Trypanosoma cruzi TaxID=5693 RepID=A0A7J6XPB9_TRYCR|nr:nucleolar RNA helicase II [Trypanosoma cruzi]